MLAGAGDPQVMLVLRCQEKKTEAIFSKQFSFFSSTDPLRVLVRINDAKPIETRWSPSTSNSAAFAPSAIQFIRVLPDNGKLFIRAHGYGGKFYDGEFHLGNISEVRDRIAHACNWPSK
jgi:hypothetical protein